MFKDTSQNVKVGRKVILNGVKNYRGSFMDLKLAMESEEHSQNISWNKIKSWSNRSSCRGSAVTNTTSIHEDAGSISGLSGLGIQRCHGL